MKGAAIAECLPPSVSAARTAFSESMYPGTPAPESARPSGSGDPANHERGTVIPKMHLIVELQRELDVSCRLCRVDQPKSSGTALLAEGTVVTDVRMS